MTSPRSPAATALVEANARRRLEMGEHPRDVSAATGASLTDCLRWAEAVVMRSAEWRA